MTKKRKPDKLLYEVFEDFGVCNPSIRGHFNDAEYAQFLSDWYFRSQLCLSAVLTDENWQDCMTSVNETIEKVLQREVVSLLWQRRNETAARALLWNLFEEAYAQVEFWAPDDDWQALWKQFADVYYRFYQFSSVYGLEASWSASEESFVIGFKDDAIIDLMAYAHGLAEDVWELQYAGMPEYRWANDGKGNFAWYPISEVVQLGTNWFTKKYHRKIQKSFSGGGF